MVFNTAAAEHWLLNTCSKQHLAVLSHFQVYIPDELSSIVTGMLH